MKNKINLDHHFCITSAKAVDKIARPLQENFGIMHFRYLKLFNDGSRIILSNRPDCVQFMYGEGHYNEMWFDGNFPDFLCTGRHVWDVMRVLTENNKITPLEAEINRNLKLSHGLTFIFSGQQCHEIYTFDSNHTSVYQFQNRFLSRFVSYFKDQAAQLLLKANMERIVIPQSKIIPVENGMNQPEIDFFNKTQVNRYYLSGNYSDVYLTEKEMRCVYWLVNGKSAEEMAFIEGNTKKTIQCYFENIRVKLNCYKQTQIIPIVIASGLLDSYSPKE